MPQSARPVDPPPAMPAGCRSPWMIIVAAVVVQLIAAAGIHHFRGDVCAYAFQSPDAGEYVALARGLAWQGAYLQLSHRGEPLTGPDTWRTPGYPLFLAVVVKVAGDSPRVLLIAQQCLAILSVPLFWLVLLRITRPCWALVGSLAWCLDPFRLYYSFWLLSETLFVVFLLAGCLLWVSSFAKARSFFGLHQAIAVGLVAGALVLIRPIAAPLPLLVWLGVMVAARSAGRRRLAALSVACLLGIFMALGPWMVRNYRLAGHFALSAQSGASLAYHKVVDVVLWSNGRPEFRFDSAAVAAVREKVDERLQQLWAQNFGPLTLQERESLSWHKLNYGKPVAVDPFVASSLLWRVGLDMLFSRIFALLQCFAVQGLFMLIFPLGLILWPPAGAGSAPLSMLSGGTGTWAGQLMAAAVGACYGTLVTWVVVRLLIAAARKRLPPGFFAFWPALAMFALSLPFEDPRFRLPLVPLFLIMATAEGTKPQSPPADHAS